ncbi:TRAP transporter small permease subunit [Marinobacterium lutimaris]|uniref:TRAP transporter small permease protein n=1 Tax=Marinobacterium lutimaris TaxID=568106 RepID=A0A1H5VBC2_9GAMM|nr:TRAP transporter small permease [Marinobacterium lutimaris]SEF83747.1 TRAP-type C4-dicarboxylate transport system, small permease component [Marinobacterium lutimaris]
MNTYARILGIAFGVMMFLLSAIITLETLLRKLFSFSLGGIDELGGYAIAVAAPLAFTLALIDKSHIRINQLSGRMPIKAQAVLNVIAMLSIAMLSLFFLYFTVETVIDTRTYKSIAQTPWATPLIYPQSIWLIAMLTFPATALIFAVRALIRLIKRDWPTLLTQFGTVSVQEELQAELDDLKKRESFKQ